MNVVYVPINELHQHENIDEKHLTYIKNKIKKTGVFKEPIIVDKEDYVVLDGHHRLNSCKELELSKIPCVLVEYLNDSNIRVATRRKEYKITKDSVIKMGLRIKFFRIRRQNTLFHIELKI